PMYSGWGNSGWAVWAYSIDPENADESLTPLEKISTKKAARVEKAIYPSSRWRSDFDENIYYVPEKSFLAPDGVTIIPELYDLGRSAALTEAVPGNYVFITREIDKTTVRLEVAPDGTLKSMQEIIARGEYSSVVDSEGNLYIADGQIFIFDSNLKETGRISLEERPISIIIGGEKRDILFITTHSSLYGIKIK
ncbi:MAG: gluconolaconase, partial [Bacteroidales bacterium]